MAGHRHETSTRVARAAASVLACLLVAACTSTAAKGIAGGLDRDRPPTTTVDGSATTQPTDTSPPTTDAVTVTTGDPAAATLDWGSCDDPMATDPALECATMPVPLDHDDPDGERIDIALVRVPAVDPDDRVGAIVFNPGGPGGSGFDYIAQGASAMSEALGVSNFDLIGFDPRGVDRSNGLRCQSDAEQDATTYLDSSPDTPEEQAALDAADDAFAAACLAKYGDTLRFYSTEATARDVDLLRGALGDDQISLLGISYGTYLFALYATLFPDHVRAMVLDSAYEPTGDTVEQAYTTQLVGFERAFDNWATWCEASELCAFRSVDVGADWDALSAQLDAAPVPAADGRSANQAVLEVATISALYSEADWPVLATGLATARAGDPTTLFELADLYVGRSPDGTYSTIAQAGDIIRCASGIDAQLPDDPAALVATLQQVAPRFSRGVDVDDFEDSCATLMPEVTPPALAYDGDAAVVVVGGSNDPATPFRWAAEMDAAMGAGASLVTYTGQGHGYLLTSTCVTDIEVDVLVELVVADDGTVCDPDPAVGRPAWWDDLPVPDGISGVIDDPRITEALGLGPTLAYAEARTSALAPDDVLDAYDAALEAAGFEPSPRQAPMPGLLQGVYLHADGELFSVLVIGQEAMTQPDLEGLAELVPAGQTLVLLLTFPM